MFLTFFKSLLTYCTTISGFLLTVNENPVLRADAIKYVMIFRNQVCYILYYLILPICVLFTIPFTLLLPICVLFTIPSTLLLSICMLFIISSILLIIAYLCITYYLICPSISYLCIIYYLKYPSNAYLYIIYYLILIQPSIACVLFIISSSFLIQTFTILLCAICNLPVGMV